MFGCNAGLGLWMGGGLCHDVYCSPLGCLFCTEVYCMSYFDEFACTGGVCTGRGEKNKKIKNNKK